MLEDFTLETFAGRVGQRFRIAVDDTDWVEAELAEASAIGPQPAPASGSERSPFSIVFRGPPDPLLPQRIYRFEHDELGSFDLFVVPIGRDAAGVDYEAVFT